MSRRVALVTGGCRGIGFGIARSLAQEGLDLALSGRRTSQDVSSAVQELQSMGSEVIYIQADVADRSDRQRMLDRMRQSFGRLHILVNNAGIAPPVRADLLDASEESFERVMQVNLQGPYFLTQAAARWMVSQREQNPGFSGCIINITSISASVASTNRGEYCVSKAGLSMATMLWAARLGEFNIPVYEVRPGIIRTDMTSAVQEKYDRLIDEGLAIQPRWGLPEDVGKAVAMLVRGDLPYSTGQIILVEGGMSISRL